MPDRIDPESNPFNRPVARIIAGVLVIALLTLVVWLV